MIWLSIDPGQRSPPKHNVKTKIQDKKACLNTMSRPRFNSTLQRPTFPRQGSKLRQCQSKYSGQKSKTKIYFYALHISSGLSHRYVCVQLIKQHEMQGYHNENYPGNSKEILKSWKHGTQNIKMPGPFAYLVCILNTFTEFFEIICNVY